MATGTPTLGTSHQPAATVIVDQALVDLSSDNIQTAQQAVSFMAQKLETCRNPGMLSNLWREIESAIDKIILSEKWKNLEAIIKNSLISPAKLQDICKKNELILKFCSPMLVAALKNGNPPNILNLFKDAKICADALKKFSSCFEAVAVQTIFRENWLSTNEVKALFSDPNLKTILLEVLSNALKNDDSAVANRFKRTEILNSYFEKAVHEENETALRKLIRQEIVDADLLKKKLKDNKSPKIINGLQQEFKVACRAKERSHTLLQTLLEIGITYDADDIYSIAKSGDYLLLELLRSRSVNISDAVFALIEAGPEHALIKLIEGNRDKRLDPNLVNGEGKTLLIQAVISNKPAIVKTLLAYGANPLIKDRDQKTVFQHAIGKSSRIRDLLYDPRQVRHQLGSSTTYNVEPIPEELALKQLLERKSMGKSIDKYFGLLIKTSRVVIAVLKSSSFARSMLGSWDESKATRHSNQIHCWVSSFQYPIPAEFAPNHTSMHTIGFAIITANEGYAEEELVKIDNKKYTWVKLTNEYQAEDSSMEHGFKYSYQGVQTHGHGKNLEAVRSAFKEHREWIKLGHWTSLLDLHPERRSLEKTHQELVSEFKEESENASKLEELAQKIDSFMGYSEAIIASRYTTNASEEKRWEDNSAIQKKHEEIEKELSKAHIYTFNKNRLENWRTSIQKQISELQKLEKKLQEAKCMDVTAFDVERQTVAQHLSGVKDLIVHQTVTSSEVPTFKVYLFPILLEDIFSPSPDVIIEIKKAICRTIGSNLKNIPVYIGDTLVRHFLDTGFRTKMLKQLNDEALFIVSNTSISDYRSMQELASHLAFLQDTSTILDTIHWIKIQPSQSYSNDPVLEGAMERHLASYEAARKILDTFWLDVCFTIQPTHIDTGLNLLSQRLLLMDQEMREEQEGRFIYPELDFRHPKRILDDQLFFLQTSLLIALSKSNYKDLKNPTIDVARNLIQLRFNPAFYGTEKKSHKPYEFFLPTLVEAVRKAHEIVEMVWQADPSDGSPFKRLHNLFEGYQLPAKRDIENSIEKSFKDLTAENPLPNFDPSVEELIDKTKEIKKEVRTLLEKHSSTNVSDSLQTFKNLQEELNHSIKIVKYNQFGENKGAITYVDILRDLAQEGKSADKEKIKKAINDQIAANLNQNINQLQQLTKNLTNLEQISSDKIKNLQRACRECYSSIQEYLEVTGKQSQSNSLSDFPIREVIDLLGKIVGIIPPESISKLPSVIEKLSKPGNHNIELILEIKNLLVGELKTFLSGKKNSDLLTSCTPLIQRLSEIVDPFLGIPLQLSLGRLAAHLQKFQAALYSIHLKKLIQIEEQLCLGVREQTYHTTHNDNMTYYLWDGKPFNALPYHTDNDVHIPLIHDENWTGIQFSRDTRALMENQSKLHNEFFGIGDNEEIGPSLNVTRIRDLSDTNS